MNKKARQSIQAEISHFQNYPGIDGVAKIRHVVNDICEKANAALPEPFELFLQALKHARSDELGDAEEKYLNCIAQCGEVEQLLKLQAHIMLGSIYADLDQPHRAYQVFEYVLDHRNILDDVYLSLVYTNLSDLLLSLHQFDGANNIAALGIDSSKRTHNVSNQSICWLNSGLALSNLGQHKEAIAHIDRALELSLEHKLFRVEAIALGYRAQAMGQDSSQDESEVIQWFERANKRYEDVCDRYSWLENLVLFAQYLELHGHNERALSLCKEGMPWVKPEKYFKFYRILTHTQISLCEKQGDLDNLVRLQREYITHADRQIEEVKERENRSILEKVEQVKTDQEHKLFDMVQQHMGLITDIGQRVATVENITDDFSDLFDKVRSIFETDEFGIALYDEEANRLDYEYLYDNRGAVEPISIDCNQQYSIGSYVVKNKQTVFLNHINDEVLNMFAPANERHKTNAMTFYEDTHPVQSIILTPIMLGDKVLGILSTQHELPNQYFQYHVGLFEQLANFIAIALENRFQKRRLKSANKQLEILSKTDPLTKLYNRYQLDDIAPDMVSKAQINKQNLAVAVLDVDYYKGYNDQFGHQQGDKVLQVIAQQMEKIFCDQGDNLFRYGGDEFLVLCLGQDHQQISNKLEALHAAVRALELEHPRSKCSQLVTLSIGAVNCDFALCPNMTFDTLFNAADETLYKVKAQGRNHSLLEAKC